MPSGDARHIRRLIRATERVPDKRPRLCLTAHLREHVHSYPRGLLEVAVAWSYAGLPFRVVVATGPRNRAEVTS